LHINCVVFICVVYSPQNISANIEIILLLHLPPQNTLEICLDIWNLHFGIILFHKRKWFANGKP